jgi:hypothetical protein
MRLFGLDAWTLTFALLAVAALLAALYLRKRPTRRVVVPSLALWLALEGTGGRRSAAKSLSFLLALLIASLLLGALADPRPAYQPEDIVLLIERGSAMSARDVPGTRLDEAKRAAHARVDALRPGDRAQVVSFAAHVTVNSALTSERERLHAAIERVQASDAHSDTSAAEAFVRTLQRSRVVLFSSAELRADERVRIGSSDRNVGITAFAARSYPLDRAHASCLITVANFGSQRERVVLRVSSDVTLHEEAFSLEPHAELTRTLEDLPGRTPLQASIELAGADPLPADDRAEAASFARAPRVLLVSPGDRYLEAALLVDPQLELTRAESFQPGDFDVVIFDRSTPSTEPGLPALYLGATGPVQRGAEIARPYFDRVQATPLLAGLALRNVNIARAISTRLGANERALAASANGTPLLIEGPRFLALTFALPDSDFALRAAFPVFVLRAIEHLRGEPAAVDTHRAGEPFTVRAAGTPGARIAFDRAGRYELDRPLAILPHAGPIAPQGAGTRTQPATLAWYWPILALAALLLLAFEYVAFRRGWTR